MKGDDDNVINNPLLKAAATGSLMPTKEATATPSFSGATPGSTIVSSPTPMVQKGKFKDGNYKGSLEDAIYGNFQVKAVISGGKLVDVVPMAYPNDNRTSSSINSQAFPLLRDEAVAVQSYQIDIITGASDSSPAFERSLSTALKQASL